MAPNPLSTHPAHTFLPAQQQAGQYVNSTPTQIVATPGKILHLLRRHLKEGKRGLPHRPLGPFHTDTRIWQQPPREGVRITWFGHSSLLIELDGTRILTDPIWSSRASFVSFAGPKRFYPPTLPLEQLPHLDAVLLSHDHYDHLDRSTMQRLRQRAERFVCSLGMERYLVSWGIPESGITALNWGEGVFLPSGCEIIATPARHFSGRSLWSRNQTLWSSFVLRSSRHNLFYGGDSGLFPGFAQIGAAYGPFDVTMLEIGAADPDWPDIHMGPEKATQAHLALRGKQMLPIHWGLFNLAFHPWDAPVEQVLQYAAEKGISLLLPAPGVPFEVNGDELRSFWWRAGT